MISWKILLMGIKISTFQLLKLNKLIKYSNLTGKVAFVCVSRWMKNVMETDSFRHSHFIDVIPNPIDTETFKYFRKNPEDRKNILILRSFNSYKYAGDLIVRTIIELSSRPFFNELNFYLRGWGGMFDELTKPLKCFKNIEIHKGYIEQASIPDLHKKYGIILCHTRQDTHGVSMCEAMSSGLVPIASNNSAIPEYVEDRVTGFLPANCKEAADRIEYLYRNPDKFLEMSAAASESMMRIAGINEVIPKEMKLIENMLSKWNPKKEL
jgi:glycosyltransferase involved in cell wall biosynthesis